MTVNLAMFSTAMYSNMNTTATTAAALTIPWQWLWPQFGEVSVNGALLLYCCITAGATVGFIAGVAAVAFWVKTITDNAVPFHHLTAFMAIWVLAINVCVAAVAYGAYAVAGRAAIIALCVAVVAALTCAVASGAAAVVIAVAADAGHLFIVSDCGRYSINC